MTEEVEQKRPTLEGEAALRLWRQGPDAWNSWIDQHPGWNISFEGVDFSTERDPYGNLSFADYHFGDGNVNFSNATFGKGDVRFFGAIFSGSSEVHVGWPPKLSLVAEDPQDGARLRRLKEIAETNKDHQAALRFSADENRAKRWIETSWFGSLVFCFPMLGC